jgi:hypothetical protein
MRGKRPDEGDICLLGVYARLFFQDECFKDGKGGALKLTSDPTNFFALNQYIKPLTNERIEDEQVDT